MKKNLLTVSILLFLFCVDAISQTAFFVSPNGKDTNPGTKQKPFRTIEHAQLQARGVKKTVTVYLGKGTYYLSKPLVFTSIDARSENNPLLIKNADNEKVTISGSVPLKLQWLPYKKGVFQAKVSQKLVFDQLFVNGKLQRMARYPNYNPKARFLGGTSADAIGKQRAATWKSPEGGYVHALHRSEWGDFHYVITGKTADGELSLEGGWQNNRRMGMHPKYRFVENIFEELDTVNEWFFDKKTNILYYYPPKDLDLKTALVETPQTTSLFEFKGSETAPVTNISIQGLTLTQTVRTFMDNKEPLLRSDWTIYRGGAVFFDGAENCNIKDCFLNNLGGNGIFFNNYNRRCRVSDNQISDIGASAVCFVGDPKAVRSPSFEYNEFVPMNKMDRTSGPKTNNFPAECSVYDNLMFNSGMVEKQSAGVEISMSQSITVSHNTIYDVPRAGINVSEGTWGGHIIEYNDVFNTVKETGDHGSFNSWGRDRYWHPDKNVLDSIVEHDFGLAMLDVVKPIIIRNNRFRCDHGWDIDLDDGSSNYQIYNNLCLNGGLKLREGVNRTVENNIMVNNSFHPHVWFKNSNDVFKHNIVSASYKPIGIRYWGKEIDYNEFPDVSSLKQSQTNGIDAHSVYGDPLFVNPKEGNFSVKEGSPALKVGFKNFSMDNFGVVSPKLKIRAKKVNIPTIFMLEKMSKDNVIDFMGAKLKNLNTLGEQSATGMGKMSGVLVLNVVKGSEAAKYFQPNDVIILFNDQVINILQDLLEARMAVIGSKAEIVIFRNQKEKKQVVELNDKK